MSRGSPPDVSIGRPRPEPSTRFEVKTPDMPRAAIIAGRGRQVPSVL